MYGLFYHKKKERQNEQLGEQYSDKKYAPKELVSIANFRKKKVKENKDQEDVAARL